MGTPCDSTVTVPCSIPVGITFGKSDMTCCGRAGVATLRSAEERLRPSITSRTAPPTIQERWPAWSSVRSRSSTAGGKIARASTGGARTGRSRLLLGIGPHHLPTVPSPSGNLRRCAAVAGSGGRSPGRWSRRGRQLIPPLMRFPSLPEFGGQLVELGGDVLPGDDLLALDALVHAMGQRDDPHDVMRTVHCHAASLRSERQLRHGAEGGHVAETQERLESLAPSGRRVPRRGPLAQLAELPRAFWMVNAMETLERLAYYGVRVVIPVYIAQADELHGLHFSQVQKGTIFMLWALVQAGVPVFSGGFADRYGYKRTIAVSIAVKATGYLLMATQREFWPFTLGCLTLALGTAVFKPGVQGTLVRTLTDETSSVGWGTFYMVVNLSHWTR